MIKLLIVISSLALLSAIAGEKESDPKPNPVTYKMLAEYWRLTAISISLEKQAQSNAIERGNHLVTIQRACADAEMNLTINPQTNVPSCLPPAAPAKPEPVKTESPK